MHKKLVEILTEKKNEVALLKKEKISTQTELIAPFPIRNFKESISVPGRINLIAEIKFASPSVGIIRENFDPVAAGKIYEEAGAAAISLLTDKKFFKGDLKYLPIVKKAVSLPVLRKDFIIDKVQVTESFLSGADAVLLIARILSLQTLTELIIYCKSLGLAALTEVHNRDDLANALKAGADIIGINNRDLDTFKVDLKTTLDLAADIPQNIILVSESGIKTKENLFKIKKTGINAVLVGTGLMENENIGAKAGELIMAGRL